MFVTVFSYLAHTFGYPKVLAEPAETVLPRLLALGTTGRAVWLVYALIPLLLLPTGIGIEAAFRTTSPVAARAAKTFAVLSAIAMTVGLLRWPTLQWELARAWMDGAAVERNAITPLFDGLNTYLGTFLGELAGELFLNLFLASTALAMLRTPSYPRWATYAGFAVSILGAGAMLRNVRAIAGLVAPIANLNNIVLPVWLVVLGVVLMRRRSRETHAASCLSNA